MRIALDTNVLAYAEGVDDPLRQKQALALLDRLRAEEVILPAQVLGELFNVLVRKAGFDRSRARTAVLSWRAAYQVVGTTTEGLLLAAEVAVAHEISIWDGVIIATAASAGCRLLLSGDLHDGFTWAGLTVANPFARPPHPLLADLVDRP